MKTASALALLLGTLGLATPSVAKPPTLDRLFPPGGRVGQTTAVTASGTFDHWPVRAWADDSGIEVKAEGEKGKLSVAVAAEVAPGVHWLRVWDEEGASLLRPFVVGTLPEVLEVEPKEGPMTLDRSRLTINGRLGRNGDIDEFTVPLKKGETLVAAVDANRRLGSPMDAVLQVASPEGFVLAQNDDDQGFDPLLAVEVPADGTYRVRLFAFPSTPNSTIGFAGGDAFVYRLTLTTGGFLTYGYPLAVPRSDPGRVEAHGWNVPPGARQLAVSSGAGSDAALALHPALANAAEVRLESHPALAEREPNGADRPQPILVPTTVTGRIDPAGDRDVFEFRATKGQVVTFVVEGRSLGAPLDPVLRLSDLAGSILSEADDTGRAGRDPQLSFTPPADGTYRLLIRDLHGQGGDRYVYRLTASRPEPDFQLTVAADRLTLTPGKPLAVPVTVERRNGFNGVVVVAAEGLPDGVEAAAVRSVPGKDSAKTVSLSLSASGKSGSGPFRIVGDVADGSLRRQSARTPITGFESTTDRLWLTSPAPRAGAAKTP